MDALQKLLYLAGVAQQYHDFKGELQVIPHQVRTACLRAMNIAADQAQAIDDAIYELDARPWLTLLDPFQVVDAAQPAAIIFRVPETGRAQALDWRLLLEDGGEESGSVLPEDLHECGEYFAGNVRHVACKLALRPLPAGYHRLKVTHAGNCAESLVAASPAQCFQPAAGNGSEAPRQWGLSCQLYTVRSDHNWGFGDFADLKLLVKACADAGMDFILLNPLHAPNFASENFASPYSASDRRYLNPLYIDVAAATDEFGDERLQQAVQETLHSAELGRLREAAHIEHAAVARLKLAALAGLYQVFAREHLGNRSEAALAFESFCEQGGASLKAFALHAAQHALPGVDADLGGECQMFMQWICSRQLRECQAFARAEGMRTGLVGDLAVGASSSGSEVNANRDLFCEGVSIGAPPDMMNEQGQDWALPAPSPVAMRQTGFAHFIELLRSNMCNVGGLRIDHVMGLMRLWWCPVHEAGGAYVYYPFETLFALLRLESQRQHCCVIGEDMGIVEDALREAMRRSGLYSNRLFYFEREHDGRFRDPGVHDASTLFMTNNHDVPTLAAWWSGDDLRLKHQLGIFGPQGEAVLAHEFEQRERDRGGVLAWLEQQGLLPGSWQQRREAGLQESSMDRELCAAILQCCARSRAQMFSLQLEDLQLMRDPVNVPGTYLEYPNWRRKQQQGIEQIFSDAGVRATLQAVNRERNP